MAESYKQSKTLHCNQIIEVHCNIVDCSSTNIELTTSFCPSFSSNENIDPIQDLEEFVSIKHDPCISTLMLSSLQSFDSGIDENHLYSENFFSLYLDFADDCDF